jgi:hypothetical protein
MIFRYRTVETFISAGVSLKICDVFRPLLQRAGFTLTHSSHLAIYIPKIEAAEMKLLNSEIKEMYVAIAFDGTSRLGEAINITGRWCSLDFRLVQRLIDFYTVAAHVNNGALAAHVVDIVSMQRQIPVLHLIGISRDSVSVNGAACRRLQVVYPAAADILCICHTLCHVGEHFELTTLGAFMTPWLELVGGHGAHYGAKRLWKETVSPTTVPGEP